jgi:Cu+-exporting ATPase
MMRTRLSLVALVTLVALARGGTLFAADPAPTTITVPDMHCMGCAKKMAGKLYAVPGVAKVQASVEATSLTVTPKAQQAPSPRALWEAVEKAGYKPSKLEGPSRTFTEKPRS